MSRCNNNSTFSFNSFLNYFSESYWNRFSSDYHNNALTTNDTYKKWSIKAFFSMLLSDWTATTLLSGNPLPFISILSLHTIKISCKEKKKNVCFILCSCVLSNTLKKKKVKKKSHKKTTLKKKKEACRITILPGCVTASFCANAPVSRPRAQALARFLKDR